MYIIVIHTSRNKSILYDLCYALDSFGLSSKVKQNHVYDYHDYGLSENDIKKIKEIKNISNVE